MTLKARLAQWLRPPSEGPIPFAELVDRLPDDAHSPETRKSLRELAADLYDTYRANDKLAIAGQSQHELIVLAVGVFGTIAVLLGILQLRPAPAFRPGLEIGAVTISGLAVLLGLVAARHHRWLLHRHQAERCQLLFWRLLIGGALWSADEADAARALSGCRADLAGVEALTYRQGEEWVEGDEYTEPDAPAITRPPASLIGLYVNVRLLGQANYFERRARGHRRWHWATGIVALPAFILSVVASLGHFVIDESFGKDAAVMQAGTWLLIASAAIPTLAGGFRLVHGALEPARNSSRYAGKHRTLAGLIDRISQHEDEPAKVLLLCSFGEQVLESEHRGWFRLMMEAEWIG